MARITELPNELTLNIDNCDALGIVRTLRQSDAQLFAGWGGYPGVNDTPTLKKLDRLASHTAALIKENYNQQHSSNVFVFSGCGTSGRIAWLCSRAYNRLLVQLGGAPCFHYLIAGGDESLIISNELPEDDPPLGTKDLQTLTKGATHVMFFGISCGLSAPYVAGQIDYSMHQPNYTTVLIGFNPVSQARDAPIEKWHKTCKKTFLELEKLSRDSERALVLNPIVGPEPVTGSSRMKGGSMTAILLNTIYLTAISRAFDIPLKTLLSSSVLSGTAALLPGLSASAELHQSNKSMENSADDHYSSLKLDSSVGAVDDSLLSLHSLNEHLSEVTSVVDAFSSVFSAAYRPSEGISSLMNIAADCLKHPDGHLYYLGADTFGILGLIDGSEMVDTYGAAMDEIRGFVVDGWAACDNQQGDLSDKGQLFRISHTHFMEDIFKHLTCHDCVIHICTLESYKDLNTIMDRVLSSPASCGLIAVVGTGSSKASLPEHIDKRYSSTVVVQLPFSSVLATEPVFAGFAIKLILNVISSGVNVLKGRVYGNKMINLTVANDKLFYRSIAIISELSGAGGEDATAALLRAIHRGEEIETYKAMSVSSHISAATTQNMVIPVAVLLASQRCATVSEAVQVLSSCHSLKTVIQFSQKEQ